MPNLAAALNSTCGRRVQSDGSLAGKNRAEGVFSLSLPLSASLSLFAFLPALLSPLPFPHTFSKISVHGSHHLHILDRKLHSHTAPKLDALVALTIPHP